MEQYRDYFECLLKEKDMLDVICHAMCLANEDRSYWALANKHLKEKAVDTNTEADTEKFIENIDQILTLDLCNISPLLNGNRPHIYWFEKGLAI